MWVLDTKADPMPVDLGDLYRRAFPLEGEVDEQALRELNEVVQTYAKDILRESARSAFLESLLEVFVGGFCGDLWEKRDRYDRDRPLKPWLKTVIKHLWIDFYRKEDRHTGLMSDATDFSKENAETRKLGRGNSGAHKNRKSPQRIQEVHAQGKSAKTGGTRKGKARKKRGEPCTQGRRVDVDMGEIAAKGDILREVAGREFERYCQEMPFSEGDLRVMDRWGRTNRIVFLCLKYPLYRLVPSNIWAKWLRTCGIDEPFPPDGFDAATEDDRRALLAEKLGSEYNVDRAWYRARDKKYLDQLERARIWQEFYEQ